MHEVSGVEVSGCVVADVGGRGFTTTLETTGSAQDASNLLLTDSVIQGCGKVVTQQPYCVFISGKQNITVRNNDISDVPYSGIRVWGHFPTSSAAAVAFDAGGPAVFTVVQNHVHNLGLGMLSDFGGIFVTTIPGGKTGGDCASAHGADYCNVLAVLDGNVVHGVRHHDHGGAGIYTDESSGRANITNNLVFNCSGWGLHLHCGQWHTVENNVFVGNAAVPPAPFSQYAERDYAAEPFCNFHDHSDSVQGVVLRRNVFDQRVAPAAGVGRAVSILNNISGHTTYGNVSLVLVNTSLDLNVYSCADDGSGTDNNNNNNNDCSNDFPGASDVSGRSLAAWQTWGHEDVHSVSGDPGFPTDPSALSRRRDFRADPARSSALRAVGFAPLDLEVVGPRVELLTGLATCSNNGGDAGVWWQGCDFGAI